MHSNGVNRDTLWYAVVALLGGIAVALVASTVATTPRAEGTPGDGGGEGGRVLPPLPEDSPGSAVEPPPLLAELLVLLAAVAILVTAVFLVYNWREMLRRFAAGVAFAGAVFLLYRLLLLFSSREREPRETEFGGRPTPGGEGGAGGDQLVSTDPTSVPVMLVLLFGLALVGLALVLARRSRRNGEESEPADADAETAAAVGRAAGRAADRLEADETAANEIYRAWAEMAELVDAPDPETKTTAEFASAAVEAGMEPADVRELTALFERVRYGTDDPSAADEQRAVDLFRRIEATYAEEGP